MVVLYTAIGLFIMKRHFVGIEGFCDSVLSSAKILYFMDVSAVQPKTRMAVLFVRSAVLLNWTILLLALVFILKPLIYRPISTIHDREKVRNLLKSYGCNPISYVAMESDKKYFFGTVAEGVIAYTIINRVLLCAGDPICKTEEMPMFLSEILIFCRKNDYQICFCQITEQFMDAFKNMGFGISKYGEECMFELSEYSLEGHAASRLRQALRRAERIGIRVFEYDPQLHNNIDLEKQIMDVSSEWLAQKKSGELTFMLGTVSLNNPCDRRYFVAVDETKTVQGFIAFTPFMGGRGYMADVTRRRNNAPFGVMEKLTVDAFFKMRDEGVKWGSLGLAPLYNVKSAASKGIIPDIFNFIYENLNMFYGFKTLYQYKQKYAPTFWEPRYLAYYPIIMTPQIAYSIVKAQNPKGISNYLLMNLKRKIKE
jgi:phosphatidylglycerol lysyltransferase